jgi:asparagine synthase (glutamine-hydrolysing)
MRMNDRITRRGPDGEGRYFDSKVGLAMRRLAIIDLARGQQPIFNEDRTLALVFNGEIYNYQKLRANLEKAGHRFATDSDTEVIVHLYEEYGLDAPKHLEGMFAFALFDTPKQQLILARDRFGIKPLYLAKVPEGYVFGSEIKSLLASGVVPDDIDWQALDEYLTYTFISAPRSIYSHIRKVAPATIVTIDHRGEVRSFSYWNIPEPTEVDAHESVWIERIESALQEAVHSHLVSDVPVGAFLSGGLDSGIMIAMMAKALRHPVQTFTVGFRQAGSAFLDERRYARMLVDRYGLKHFEIDVEPHASDILDEVVMAFDEPFADDSVIPSYYISKIAGSHVKVALTGLGGDELFAGYRRHLGLVWGDRYANTPQWLRTRILHPIINRLPESRHSSDLVDHLKRFSRSAGQSPANRYQDSMATMPWEQRNTLFNLDIANRIDKERTSDVIRAAFESSKNGGSLARALRADLQVYLVDDILTLTDRLSMWHSLELRVPFLDHRLVELMQVVPTSMKIRGTTQKYLLKKLAEKWLPHEMIYHKKQGFEAPMGHWLRGPLLDYFDSVVNVNTARDIGYFSFDRIKQLRDEHVSGQRKNSKILFSLLMFFLWYRHRHNHSGG